MDLSRRERTGLIVFGIIIISIISFTYFNNSKNDTIEVISKGDKAAESTNKTTPSDKISIYICGEIKQPGVYDLNEGDRLVKLIDMAGGFTENADKESVNLAVKLSDEDFIKIPSKISDSNGDVSTANTVSPVSAEGGKININSASREQLEELPRIGEAIAQRIIDYRENIGRFKDIKDIMNVSGIGEKIFENIKDKITVH